MNEVRTRFAPSPTGYMHIGGMRTALFNWLWARHNHGRFVLRIDDTDRERNLDAALAPILAAFRWLGLDWDEGPEVDGPYGPYFQSRRNDLYHAAAEKLLREGKAFRCFDSAEQIQADRQAAESEKRPYVNLRRSLEMSERQIQDALNQGRPHVLRFLVPRSQTVTLDDAVRGHVEWDAGLMVDPVIVRSDGSPLYNFATVVDDAHMQITHVIRAEEHLPNTPVQVLIHQALGHELPQFAHIPFVAAPGSKEKLSKRKLDKYRNNPQFKKMFDKADTVFPSIGLSDSRSLDPVMVEYYERIGYLPRAILNALARLGWSLDDKTEIMSLETIVENFTLDRIVKAPAGFDPDKLLSFQAHWMNGVPLDRKVEMCVPYLVQAGLLRVCPKKGSDPLPLIASSTAKPDVKGSDPFFGQTLSEPCDDAALSYVAKVITAMGDRLKVFSDVLDFAEFFVADDALVFDEKAFEKRILKSPGAVELLTKFQQRLAESERFDAASLEALMNAFADAEGVKLGEIIHAIRVAVTGKVTGVGMFDCLAILGRERCATRIERALQHV